MMESEEGKRRENGDNMINADMLNKEFNLPRTAKRLKYTNAGNSNKFQIFDQTIAK